MSVQPILKVEKLNKHFLLHKALKKENAIYVKAVNDVSFSVNAGETLGVVGESGCGKSTLGRTLMRLHEPTSGNVWFDGKNIVDFKTKEMRILRENMQYIFQDPYSSMNPKMTVRDIVSEPLDNFRKDMSNKEKEERIAELLSLVGLSREMMNRYPHEFSGGQRQRIVIARGIALNPKLLICDESVSALDVSVQAQIINLLQDLKRKLSLTYLFISHDLRVVKFISDKIMVLYLGEIMEIAPSVKLFDDPKHPYTQSLIKSISVGDPRNKAPRQILEGEIPNPMHAPKGCPFSTRCPKATSRCSEEKPPLIQVSAEHTARCFFVEGTPVAE
ncbi:MAG: ABC transporter ATP-binding protein [Sphaerochaetaceae bacterium]|jgi:oligopeptide/dipeptide ABC transporter ATP-binding protein